MGRNRKRARQHKRQSHTKSDRSSPADNLAVASNWIYLLPILGLGLIVRLWLSFVSDMPIGPDEITETLEQAHFIAFGYGMNTWPASDGIRSYLVPGALAGLLRMLAVFGLDTPAVYINVVKAALSIFSLLIPLGMYYCGHRWFSEPVARVALVLGCFWYELIVFAHHPLMTIIATNFLMLALILSAREPSVSKALIAGLACALAIAVRIQISPVVLFIAVVLFVRFLPLHRTYFVCGGVAGLLFAGLLDYLTWGVWWGSYYNNVYQNLVGGVASTFGSTPIYQYVWWLITASLGIFILVAIAAGIRVVKQYTAKKHSIDLPLLVILTAIFIALITHSLIDHKEYRFIIVVIPLWLMLASYFVCRLSQAPQAIAATLLLVVSVAGLMYKLPLQDEIYLWEGKHNRLQGFDGYKVHSYTDKRGDLQALRYLSEQSNVTGVISLAMTIPNLEGWFYYLHKKVPYYSLLQYPLIKDSNWRDYASHIITTPPQFQRIAGFTPIETFRAKGFDVILWQRDVPNPKQYLWKHYKMSSQFPFSEFADPLPPAFRLPINQ